MKGVESPRTHRIKKPTRSCMMKSSSMHRIMTPVRNVKPTNSCIMTGPSLRRLITPMTRAKQTSSHIITNQSHWILASAMEIKPASQNPVTFAESQDCGSQKGTAAVAANKKRRMDRAATYHPDTIPKLNIPRQWQAIPPSVTEKSLTRWQTTVTSMTIMSKWQTEVTTKHSHE